jgi:hypothetical protein
MQQASTAQPTRGHRPMGRHLSPSPSVYRGGGANSPHTPATSGVSPLPLTTPISAACLPARARSCPRLLHTDPRWPSDIPDDMVGCFCWWGLPQTGAASCPRFYLDQSQQPQACWPPPGSGPAAEGANSARPHARSLRLPTTPRRTRRPADPGLACLPRPALPRRPHPQPPRHNTPLSYIVAVNSSILTDSGGPCTDADCTGPLAGRAGCRFHKDPGFEACLVRARKPGRRASRAGSSACQRRATTTARGPDRAVCAGACGAGDEVAGLHTTYCRLYRALARQMRP